MMPLPWCCIFLLWSLPSSRAVVPPRLADWMGDVQPLIGNLTLLDLSLPGTHDTLTYDLSSTVADNANDLPSWASFLLHTFHSIDGVVGDFIKQNAVTQEINVTQQLNAGVRFLDLRTIYTSAPDSALKKKDWYSLHMVESNQRSMFYFSAVAKFLQQHPTEVVVVMLTRHGCQQCTGDQQYPGATNAEKQSFWTQIKRVFQEYNVGFIPSGGPGRASVNTTSLSKLIASNRRVLMYTGDYVNFTASDPLAWDAGKYLYNGGAGENVNNMKASFAGWDSFYRSNAKQREKFKAANTFFLMSLAGSPPQQLVQVAGEIYLESKIGLPPSKSLLKKCSDLVNIPNVSQTWCPSTLNEWERLRNFYSQVFLDRVVSDEYSKDYTPPGAIYLDVLGTHGEIRTDTIKKDKHAFGYVDTLLLWNVRRACGGGGGGGGACASIDAALVERRAHFPMTRWDDEETGRHSMWP